MLQRSAKSRHITTFSYLHAQNSNISGNHVGSVGTLLGYGGGVYVADHCTNGVCGKATATLTNKQIDGNYAHEACLPAHD